MISSAQMSSTMARASRKTRNAGDTRLPAIDSNSDCQSDVCGDNDRPASRCGPPGNAEIDQRRQRHAADGCRDRQEGSASTRQTAVDQFSLDLQADDEEEDRDEAFVDTLSKDEVHRVGVEAK